VSGVYRIPPASEYDDLATGVVDFWMRRAGLDSAPSPTLGVMVAGVGKGLNPFRRAFGEDSEVCKQASPLTHVHAGLAPFLLINAESDIPTLPEMAKEFATALRKAGCAVESLQAPGRTHHNVLFRVREKDDVVGKVICDFIAKHGNTRRR